MKMQNSTENGKKYALISYLACLLVAVLILILLSYLAQNRNNYIASQDEEQAAVYVYAAENEIEQ